MSKPTTKSPVRSLIPRTPPACRPISRTADSLKRIDWPLEVVSTTSSPLCANRAQMSASPLSSEIEINPLRRTSRNLSAETFFTVPFLVANTSESPSMALSSFGIARTDVTVSPCSSERKFIIDLPFVARLPSGKSYILSWYALPLSEKKRMSLCALAVRN